MLGITILASQGFSSNCSLFRARLCWGGGGGSVAFEVFYMYLVYTPDGIVLAIDIVLLVRGCCSRTDEYRAIFRTKVVRHAHWCTGLPAGEDVEHAGGILD